MKLISKKTILSTRPFDVEEITFEYQDLQPKHPYYRLSCPDWVNVLPITTDGQAILIEQPRIGSMTVVMETPGGVVDRGEKDPTMAAVRELEEETGFTTQRILSLGSINPNPAIMTNTCHFFLALGCAPVPKRIHLPDADERIALRLTPIHELDALVRQRQINHALSSLCILLAQKYLPMKS